jgi:hypothetical protein
MKIKKMGGFLVTIGYHGTRMSLAATILSDGFMPSTNEYDWLGDGVYFFQDAPNRAREWAEECYAEDSVVIGAEIELRDCIDLIDTGWSEVLADVYDSYLEKLKSEGIPLPRQTTGAHRLDRAVLNYAVSVLNENGFAVRSIRAAFIEGSPIFPNSALLGKAHVQIVVRDTTIIKKMWLENPAMEVIYDRP